MPVRARTAAPAVAPTAPASKPPRRGLERLAAGQDRVGARPMHQPTSRTGATSASDEREVDRGRPTVPHGIQRDADQGRDGGERDDVAEEGGGRDREDADGPALRPAHPERLGREVAGAGKGGRGEPGADVCGGHVPERGGSGAGRVMGPGTHSAARVTPSSVRGGGVRGLVHDVDGGPARVLVGGQEATGDLRRLLDDGEGCRPRRVEGLDAVDDEQRPDGGTRGRWCRA